MLRALLGFLRRHPLAVAGLVLAWWLWPRSSPPPAPSRPQAAVLDDGFAAIDSSNRVVVLDDDGSRRRALSVSGITEPRLVGFASGMGLVWRDGKRVAAADLADDGRIGKPAKFGSNVQLMCSQTASNDHKFAVGWTERDGAVWFVHGPTAASAEAQLIDEGSARLDENMPFAGELAKPTFCAVASAADKVALLWNDGDKVMTVKCGKKCPNSVTRIALPKRHQPLGFGCTADACVIATREGNALYATWATERGKVLWTKPLRDAEPSGRVELVGTGAQVAIAYATANQPVVVAATRGGELAAVWQGEAEGVPSIQWSSGRLVIVRHVGGDLVGSVARVP